MSDFIFYSGIIAFCVLMLTIALKVIKKKPRWHVVLGYTTFALALAHGAVAIYKNIRLYFLYS